MSALSSYKQKPLHILEKEINKLAKKDVGIIFSFNRSLYNLGRKLFDVLPLNWKPRNNTDLVMLILLLRGLENIRTVELLVRKGYLAQAASLTTNSIEIFLQSRKTKTDIQGANQWLSHISDRICWPITGERGLCRELGLQKVEGDYRLLCTVKHTQNKTKHLNIISKDGYNALFMAPIWSAEIAKQIMGYNLSSIGDTIQDSGDILSDIIPAKAYINWQKRLALIRNTIRLYYLTWQLDQRKISQPQQ